jgi:exosortase E/protease (VPEID-CTERM system)
MTEELWYPLRYSTLRVVHALVTTIAPDPIVDSDRYLVGTERFWVQIAPGCSGYEGVGLVLVFLGVYLFLFRKSLRFPHAFLLIPLGTAVVWVANAGRITALIAIGTWISPDIALGGFHSYSGSLLFCGVALSLVFFARRSAFFTPAAVLEIPTSDNPTATYLSPFLAIVVTTMVTGAASTGGGFDRLYPLRVLAAAGTLWLLRKGYRELRWTWSWSAVLWGALAFAVWMALEPTAATSHSGEDLGPGLLGLSAPGAAAWLTFRVLGAVVTVPLAEELAFRGYLTRRLVSADFESVSLRSFSWPGFLGSSVLFGMMHSRPVAGTLAGMIYATVLRRRGELTDAVVAHATTNALLAIYVLVGGQWSLWG